jgi:hypothetical protein
MRRVLIAVTLAAVAVADDGIVDRWDQPRRESFDLKAVTAQQAAEEVKKRYGVGISVVAHGGVATADFAATGVTFLEALDRLAALHGLAVSGAPVGGTAEWGEPRPLALARPAMGVRPVAASHIGGSRLSVEGVSVVAVLACAPEPQEERLVLPPHDDGPPGLSVRLRWIAEPGLDSIARFAFEVVAAEDDTGQRLPVLEGRPWQQLEFVSANRDFVVRLERPSPKATAIRKLEGRLKVAIPLERAKIEFAANEIGQTKALGGAQVSLDAIDEETKEVTISVHGAPCAGLGEGAYPHLRVGSMHGAWSGAWGGNAIRVSPYGADGREIDASGTRTGTDDGKWTARISLGAVPKKISVDALVRAVVRDATFSFKDIPLPE